MVQTGFIQRIRQGISVLLISGGFFISGCQHSSRNEFPQEYVAPSSGSPWKPIEETKAESILDSRTVDIPEKLLEQGSK